MTEPRVVGLDLSLTATGIALPDGTTRTIITKTGDGDLRLNEIHYQIRRVLLADDDAPWPTLVAVEDLPTHAHGAGITGMVHGVARFTLNELATPYVLITAASLKKYATGAGNADKADMRMALYQRAGIDLKDHNQVDAWWLRAMALDHLGHPPVAMPKTHRAALDKVVWP